MLRNNILKTLLYYDIFSHPLRSDEIYTFLSQNTVTKDEITEQLKKEALLNGSSLYAEKDGYYYIKPNEDFVCRRIQKEEYSKKMWRSAYFATHLIKRFPFVRSVMVTGTLSKNSSDKSSDIDFFLVTAPGRLWIARTFLMLFKKIFLLNSKKYFCINYCITEDALQVSERNIFTATEIATIKATYNSALMKRFVESNKWIKEFFPNYILNDASLHTSGCKVQNRSSIIQKIGEMLFRGNFGNKLDYKLMLKTIEHWRKKYPHLEESERMRRLKSTPTESRVHPHSVQEEILTLYNQKLESFNL